MAALAALLLAVVRVIGININVGNITYQVNEDNTMTVLSLFDKYFKGEIIIPEKVTFESTTYTVTSINNGAFHNCTGLTAVELPSSLTSIGEGAFNGCSGLTSIELPSSLTNIEDYAFLNCTSLTAIELPSSLTSIGESFFNGCSSLASIKIPSSLTNIGDYAFLNCTSLTAIELPSSLTSIGENAFKGCIGLTSIKFPSSLTNIGNDAFGGCSGLTSIELPSSLIKIGSAAFGGCSSLTSVKIPSSVKNIEERTFYRCSSLTSVEIPSSVTSIGEHAFYSCPLDSLVIPGQATITLGDEFIGSDTNRVSVYVFSQDIYIYSNALRYVQAIYLLNPRANVSEAAGEVDFSGTAYGTRQVLDQMDWVSAKEELYSLKSNAYMGALSFSFDEAASGMEFGEVSCVYRGDTINVKKEGNEYRVEGLHPQTECGIEVNVRLGNVSGTIGFVLGTRPMGVSTSLIKRTQTTMTVGIAANNDETYNMPVIQVRGNGYAIDINDYTGGTRELEFQDLAPDEEVALMVYAYYVEEGDTWSDFYAVCHAEYTTLSMFSSPPVVTESLTPSAFKGIGSYVEGDATVLRSGFGGYGRGFPNFIYDTTVTSFDTYQEGKSSILEMTGLLPGQQYFVWYKVETEEGGKDSISYTFTTPALTFETLPAKATSNTVALICAETNLSDMETGAGFEWRRYDAPDLVPSTQSPCPVVDGVLTGALRNLSASTYYKFRPYYTSASGLTYYGDWLAFGTADAYVYFDPTVRTYEATGVTKTEARVRGYAIAGSDEITEQGFEYWPEGAPAKRSAADVRRVQAEGQLMTATLEDLLPGMTYTFRVYVETAKGTTYGEEQTFTTVDNGTGIPAIIGDDKPEGLKVAVRGSLSSGNAFIQVPGNGEEARWTLTGIGGAMAAQGNIRADGTWQTLDAPALPRGLYLLTVHAGETAKTIKLLAR